MVNLSDYITAPLEEKEKNVYYISKSPIIYDGTDDSYNNIDLKFKDNTLDYGGYKLVFDLYSEDKKINTIEKKFIVK